ncbi:hypothetical protein SCUCBS95973_007729 [Sporothrix curviconia]|uniref:Uncharacterized protein n=1 Tax=Sporothrix curviconia TaxID=1260050 RepID=A0ABP0CG17_9PEZI
MAADNTQPLPSTSASASTALPSVSWLHAFPPLPILASSAMAQPAGRLLGVSAINSVWLRASPLLCALDALAVVVRGCVYCAVLQATPRQAVALLGTDRFEPTSAATETVMSALPTSDNNNDNPNAHERGTTTRIAAMARVATATAIRLGGFGIGIVPLVELMWFEPGGGEAKWTAAWAWMFVGSYIVLEIVVQAYRWEQAQPQYTAADFELDEAAEAHGDDDPAAGSGTEEGVPYDSASTYAESEATLNEETAGPNDHGDHNDNDNDADTAGLLANNNASTGTPAGRAQSTAATPSTRDVEANKAHPYEYNNDPSAHPRLPAVNALLARLDKACLALGCLAHAVFLYWAFLDLVQPPINAHILAVDVHKNEGWDIATSWATPLYYLGFPLVVLSLFFDLAVGLALGFAGLAILVGLGNRAVLILPASAKDCGGGVAPGAIMVVAYGAGTLCVLTSFFAMTPVLAEYTYSAHMRWIYQLLMFELILLLLFVAACFVVYGAVKALATLFNARWQDDLGPDGEVRAENNSALVRHILQYTGEDSVALFFVFLVTLLLTAVWYAVRFAGSAHWAQHWADALVANVTSNSNSTVGNSTLANDTLASATAAAAAAASAAPVKLF